MHKTFRLASLILIFLAVCLTLASMSLTPQDTTYADELNKPASAVTCTAGATFTITDVNPATITNGSDTTIFVSDTSGTTFPADSQVIIEGFGGVTTNVESPTQLSAVVPGSIRTGRYSVTVIDGSNNSCTMTRALTVRSNAPAATRTPEPTTYVRPQTQVVSYSPSPKSVYPGQNLDFTITLQSVGQVTARNVTATFVTGDLVPRETGGVHYVGDLAPGATTSFPQPLRVSSQIGTGEAVMKMQVVYTDDYGTEYTDNFDVAVFPVYYQGAATATPTLAIHPQIALTGYQTTPAVLGPGTVFTLDLDLTNLSGELARQLVIDLGSSASSGTSVSSSSLIMPVNSSSSRYVDQLETGQTAHVTFNMAVSGDATGQFVPVAVSMSYYDSSSTQHNQTENISLRIDTRPALYVHFLNAPPTEVMVGDPLDLPVEVINIGAGSLNVSTIEVISETMTVTDGSLYIGPLDAGTSGTVPSQFIAQQAGAAVITVNVHYLDDFQQAQVATYDLTLQVIEQPTPMPEENGENGGKGQNGAVDGELGIFDRILRAFLGFFGLSTRPVGGGFIGGPSGGGNGENGGNGGGGGSGPSEPVR